MKLFSYDFKVWIMVWFFFISRDLTKLSTFIWVWHAIRQNFKANRFRAVSVWGFGAVKQSILTTKWMSGGVNCANWNKKSLCCTCELMAGCSALLAAWPHCCQPRGRRAGRCLRSGLAKQWCAGRWAAARKLHTHGLHQWSASLTSHVAS